MTNLLAKIIAALALCFVASGASADGAIQVRDAWVQAAPPGAKVLAAYMELENGGSKRRTLVGVSSPAFGQVGIHRSVIHGNMAHMEHLKELVIPPNAPVVLQPGGLHLMLMDAKQQVKVDDQIPLTLFFGDGEKIAVSATVRPGKMRATEDHHKMDHSGHGAHKH
jgi:copper(I)-binding protein